jgi:hypothetical protein
VSRLSKAAAVAAALAVAGVTTLAAAGSGPDAHAERAGRPLPGWLQGRCPKVHAQRLPRDSLAGATLAVLDQADAVYGGTKLEGMRTTKAVLARVDDPGRGRCARVECGRRMQNRTIVVYLEFPAMRPSASLSQGVVLVSRFAGRYRVWSRLH